MVHSAGVRITGVVSYNIVFGLQPVGALQVECPQLARILFISRNA